MFSSDVLLNLIWKSFLTVIPAIYPVVLGQTLTVDTCPKTRISWENRATNFSCNAQRGLVYHCIQDDTERLVETCVARVEIPSGKDGCPEVTFLQGEAYHSNFNSECPQNQVNCPSAKSAYFSDQLYLYPICFWNVSSRAQYTEDTQETNDQSTENKDTEGGNCPNILDESGNNSSPLTIILIMLSVILAIVLAISCYIRRCSKSKLPTCNACIWLKKSFCDKSTATETDQGVNEANVQLSFLNS